MKRIKMLLLAAMGVLALMASAGPAAASASGMTFSEYPATANAAETSTHVFGFSEGRSVGCTFTGFSASASGPTETLAAPITPVECSSESEGKVTLKMNGCKLIYHPAVGMGSVDIGPAGCGPITMEGANCTRSFSPQTGLATSFSNEGGSPSTVKIKDEASGVQYTLAKGTLAACGTSGSGTFTGSWQLKAFNNGGTQIGAQVVGGTGFYMTGKKSAEPGSQPKFEAEQYPVTITGFQDSANKQALTIGGNRKLQCQEVNTLSTASAASSQISLGMEYGACVVTVLGNEFPAAVSTNSCSLVLHALNAGPPYSGSIDVACAKEGEAIEVNTYNGGALFCTYKISPQLGLTGVGLSNVGSGNERGVTASFGLSGIVVTRTSGTLAACGGASQKATYTGATTLHGVS